LIFNTVRKDGFQRCQRFEKSLFWGGFPTLGLETLFIFPGEPVSSDGAILLSLLSGTVGN
jgi:hypothetical protein